MKANLLDYSVTHLFDSDSQGTAHSHLLGAILFDIFKISADLHLKLPLVT